MTLAEAVIQLIIQGAIPLAEQLWKMFSSQNPQPTQADWDTLKVIAANTARTRMLDALKSNGIDPASPQGQAFMALVP